ncbi:hypothetical protein VTK73DRAFT_4557 [Phialemonium thermophilum]|uniref:Uncharacterized protein n=1 Tax=Phialemonium thermophilum TaxID=223376 RepID=A0ABR3V894_9PEZI
MQELEHDAGLMRVLREHAAERGDAGPPSPSSAPSSVLMAPEEEANVDAQSAQVKTTRSTTEVVPLATTPGGGQRNSRNFVGDDYIPPPFTPLAEEFEGRPAIGNGGGGGGGAGGAARKKDRTPTTPRTWILDTNGAAAATAAATSPAADGGVQGSYFAQSPVEMQSPSALGIVMQGGGPRSA